MKINGCEWIPRAQVTFTKDEVSLLSCYAGAHYDGVCRSLACVGGMIYGFHNRFAAGENLVTVHLSGSDLDLLTKVMERHGTPASNALYAALREATRNINREYEDMNHVCEAPVDGEDCIERMANTKCNACIRRVEQISREAAG